MAHSYVCSYFHCVFSTKERRKLITPDLSPAYHDEELLVIGVNTARSFTFVLNGFWKDGRISAEQMQEIAVPPGLVLPGPRVEWQQWNNQRCDGVEYFPSAARLQPKTPSPPCNGGEGRGEKELSPLLRRGEEDEMASPGSCV